jgi:hypothetical protein
MSRTYRSKKGVQPYNPCFVHSDIENSYQQGLEEARKQVEEFHRDGSWTYGKGCYGKAHDRLRGRRAKVRQEIRRVCMTEHRDDYSPDSEMLVRSHGRWSMY